MPLRVTPKITINKHIKMSDLQFQGPSDLERSKKFKLLNQMRTKGWENSISVTMTTI